MKPFTAQSFQVRDSRMLGTPQRVQEQVETQCSTFAAWPLFISPSIKGEVFLLYPYVERWSALRASAIIIMTFFGWLLCSKEAYCFRTILSSKPALMRPGLKRGLSVTPHMWSKSMTIRGSPALWMMRLPFINNGVANIEMSSKAKTIFLWVRIESDRSRSALLICLENIKASIK